MSFMNYLIEKRNREGIKMTLYARFATELLMYT